jgi:hypothetical protein
MLKIRKCTSLRIKFKTVSIKINGDLIPNRKAKKHVNLLITRTNSDKSHNSSKASIYHQ